MSIVIADKLHKSALEIFKERGLACEDWDKSKPLSEALQGKQALIVRSATKVDAALLSQVTDLKVVGRAGVGIDNVDVEAATRSGIVVMNAPHGNSVTTAEHSLALLLSLARNLPEAHRSMREGKWEKSRFQGVELLHKTLGLIGCGSIGSLLAKRALGLGMRVMVQDPNLREEQAKELGVILASRDEVLAQSDFISLHTPLLEETRGMVNREFLAKMRKGSRLINCARGPLVVEADLAQALESGHLAGAALDVFDPEPPTNSPLLKSPNIVLSPHLGATTAEAQEKTAQQMASQIADFLLEGAVRNALNQPSLSSEESRRLQPCMRLVSFLSGFAAQLFPDSLKALDLLYEGKVAKLDTRPLAQVAAMALLQRFVSGVNAVNAMQLAQTQGLRITERRAEDAGEYRSRIVIAVTSSKGRVLRLTGTTFSGFLPRLLDIDGIPLEAEANKNMLYISHEDRPGLVGELGTLLGKAGINIGTFHLGREEKGKRAIALLSLDAKPPLELQKSIEQLDKVRRVVSLSF